MMDGETIAFLRMEIRKQVNIVLSGLSGTNTQFSEDIQSQYPGSPTLPARPVMHPYGLVSRAPSQTVQVVARVGDHPGNRMVLGHRDAKRPSLNSGEVQLYNAFGQAIYLKNGQVQLGKVGASHPFLLGDLTNTVLSNLLAQIIQHTHAAPGAPPTNAAAFTEIKTESVDSDDLLSTEVFGV